MKITKEQSGIAHLAVIVALVVVTVGLVGWRVLANKNKPKSNDSSNATNPTKSTAKVTPPKTTAVTEKPAVDVEAQNWTLLTSGLGGFSMKIPDGWALTNYSGGNNAHGQQLDYTKGQAAKITQAADPYSGDTIFRFSITQYKDGASDRPLDSSGQKSTFDTTSLNGYKYYEKYPVQKATGIGPYPGMEKYVYIFDNGTSTTAVTYNIFNYNQFSKDIIGIKASDPNRLELVERAIKTLKVN